MNLTRRSLVQALAAAPAVGAAGGALAQAGPLPANPSSRIGLGTPQLLIGDFAGAEGLTFNAAGELFVGGDNQIWLVQPDGAKRKIADVYRHLGQAPIGRRDILAADFGPTNAFQQGPNDDGMVWRITPEGKKTVHSTGIGDPNAIVMLRDRSYLVSDDAIDKIYRVKNRKTSVWTSQVPFPNGMALSQDERFLYVAQIFETLKPTTGSNKLWRIPLRGARPGKAELVAELGNGFLDGLAADDRGRIYVADNGGGQLWRYDPEDGKAMVIADGMPALASLAFGQGRFDRTAIYATSTQRGGGRIWKIPVGARGGRLYH